MRLLFCGFIVFGSTRRLNREVIIIIISKYIKCASLCLVIVFRCLNLDEIFSWHN